MNRINFNSSGINEDSRKRILEKLDQGTFAFPEEVRVTEQVAKDTEKARLNSAEFMARV